MLTIGLDLRPTEVGFKAHAGRGTGRYTIELVNNLHQLEEQASELGISLKGIKSADLSHPQWEKRLLSLMPCGRQTVESQLFYSRKFCRVGVDAVHFFSHGDAPALPFVPQITTVLDLIPLRFPHLYRPKKSNLRFKFARFLEYQAIRAACGLLAISEATKKDIVELLSVPEQRIVVTPLAVSEAFQKVVINPAMREEIQRDVRISLGLELSRPILLYIGGIDPRKNILFLLKVVSELRLIGLSPLLVLAGNYSQDAEYPKLMMRLKELDLAPNVELCGFVSDERLRALYHAANIFVFPSLYEGFGLPVLEAMACGLPVVAGRNSSIPEIAGEAAVLCADNQTEEWVGAIKDILFNQNRQREMCELGQKQAKMFSWRKTAELTLSAYKSFLAQSR